ncbi:MAG TPA: glycoside hydrolase family 3 protein, partial [Mycobacterium sp.]
MAQSRALLALTAMAGFLLACSPTAEQAAAPSGSVSSRTMAATAGPAPAASPAAPACGDGEALLAGMSTRDKLAQLLMVGVTGAADARAVVDSHHIGG